MSERRTKTVISVYVEIDKAGKREETYDWRTGEGIPTRMRDRSPSECVNDANEANVACSDMIFHDRLKHLV